VNLRKVNIRPDEINKIFEAVMLPVTLKAGMIGNLQINVTLNFFLVSEICS